MTIGLDHDVIGAIEPLALVAIRHDGDLAPGFQARHALGGMLTGNEAACGSRVSHCFGWWARQRASALAGSFMRLLWPISLNSK